MEIELDFLSFPREKGSFERRFLLFKKAYNKLKTNADILADQRTEQKSCRHRRVEQPRKLT